MDTETTTDILTESSIHLAEAKSWGLICMLICEATQTGKFWDEIMGILRMKLYNANMHTYTSCFMEIQQKDNETQAAYTNCSRQQPRDVLLTVTLWQSASLLKALEMHPLLHPKYMRRTPKLWLKSSDFLRNSVQPSN